MKYLLKNLSYVAKNMMCVHTGLSVITNVHRFKLAKLFTIYEELNIPFQEQIETGFRELIKHSFYVEGQLLPTEMKLTESLEVSRATIWQALTKLVNEGLLVVKKLT